MPWHQVGNFCEDSDLSFKFSVSVYLYNNGTKGKTSLAPLVLLKLKIPSGVGECVSLHLCTCVCTHKGRLSRTPGARHCSSAFTAFTCEAGTGTTAVLCRAGLRTGWEGCEQRRWQDSGTTGADIPVTSKTLTLAPNSRGDECGSRNKCASKKEWLQPRETSRAFGAPVLSSLGLLPGSLPLVRICLY